MAVTKRVYIFGTFIVSCISVALLIGAFCTQNWVEGEADSGELRKNSINFGLFQGTFINKILSTPVSNDIYMTCILGSNVCALSCKTTPSARKDEVSLILNGNLSDTSCNSYVNNLGASNLTQVWFNGGVYVSTIVFLGLSLLLAFLSAILAVYNTSRNPIEPLIGVYGLYIWNTCAAACALLVLIIWGSHYSINVTENLSFTHVMTGSYNSVTSTLAISYWLVFISMWCNVVANILLAVRAHRIEAERPPPTITIDKSTDDTIFLY